MIDPEIVQGLRERYSEVHPLVFQRSVERAETPGELFDILDSIPEHPFVWDEENRSWSTTTDLTLSKRVQIIQGS